MVTLTEYQAENFLEQEGFPIVSRIVVKDKEEGLKTAMQLGFPVVMKVCSNELIHKSEANAVRVEVTEREFSHAWDELNAVPVEKQGIIIQKFLKGFPIILGLKKDSVFGHAILVGSGGIYTELIKDVSLRITPIKTKDVYSMLNETGVYKIFSGYRGRKIDVKPIVKQLLMLSKLTEKYPNIKELDINPLIINEKTAQIVDARIVFE
jgi:succinyl-CoA synthetase beta subunit